ncbi:TIGR00730 family Rossman fold protein [Streptomyces olivochromogenes]|uniref:LOG family protein n=1 Tax=Streptomyces olivochromogenes TaxID=1963 RepID=UPI0036DD8577
MNICVFLSSADLDERFAGPTDELARLIGSRGHTLVWGGCDAGLMKVVADGTAASGGRLVGVTVDFLSHKTRWTADEIVVAVDLAERKTLMLAKADAVVILAGGLGTLDEATEILELKKHGMHQKPVVVVNSDGFYDGFKAMLLRMEAEGFLPVPLNALVHFTDNVTDALGHLESVTGSEPARGLGALSPAG